MTHCAKALLGAMASPVAAIAMIATEKCRDSVCRDIGRLLPRTPHTCSHRQPAKYLKFLGFRPYLIICAQLWLWFVVRRLIAILSSTLKVHLAERDDCM
jgi:hypothetical protein